MYNIHLKLKGLDRNNVAFILSILNTDEIKKKYTPEHDSTLWEDYVLHYKSHDGLIRKNGYYELLTKIITIIIEQLLNGTVSGVAPCGKEWELYLDFKDIPQMPILGTLLRAFAFFVVDYDIPIIPVKNQYGEITEIVRPSYTLTAAIPQLVMGNILPYTRLIQILKTYIDNDAEYYETSVVYDRLTNICGCSLDEIKALGYEYTVPETENQRQTTILNTKEN